MLAPALCSQALTTVFIISTGIETSLYTGLYALFICILSLSFVLLKTQLTITFPAMADDEDDLIEDEGIEPAYESSSVGWSDLPLNNLKLMIISIFKRTSMSSEVHYKLICLKSV